MLVHLKISNRYIPLQEKKENLKLMYTHLHLYVASTAGSSQGVLKKVSYHFLLSFLSVCENFEGQFLVRERDANRGERERCSRRSGVWLEGKQVEK